MNAPKTLEGTCLVQSVNPQEMKVYKMTPIYLRVISAHGNTSTDNDLSKARALLQTWKMEWFKNMNDLLWEINGDDKGVTVVRKKKDTSLWQ